MKRVAGRIAALVVVLVLIPAGVSAQVDSSRPRNVSVVKSPQDSVLDAMTAVLASELRCPVCQGNSIQDSPSELAQQMRDLVRDQLRSGKTPDQVRAYFVDKYGEWILLSPKAEGFNLVVYLIPLAVILVGGAVVWRTVRRWTPPTPPADTPTGLPPGS